jgi:hypothetical protein
VILTFLFLPRTEVLPWSRRRERSESWLSIVASFRERILARYAYTCALSRWGRGDTSLFSSSVSKHVSTLCFLQLFAFRCFSAAANCTGLYQWRFYSRDIQWYPNLVKLASTGNLCWSVSLTVARRCCRNRSRPRGTSKQKIRTRVPFGRVCSAWSGYRDRWSTSCRLSVREEKRKRC